MNDTPRHFWAEIALTLGILALLWIVGTAILLVAHGVGV